MSQVGVEQVRHRDWARRRRYETVRHRETRQQRYRVIEQGTTAALRKAVDQWYQDDQCDVEENGYGNNETGQSQAPLRAIRPELAQNRLGNTLNSTRRFQ